MNNKHHHFSAYARDPKTEWTCANIALNGDLESLEYVHKNGWPWDAQTSSSAACRGHIECLEYAHENGCPWDEKTCESAAQFGHLECLKYALKEGCPCVTLRYRMDSIHKNKEIFLPILRLVLQRVDPPIWVELCSVQPVNMCLAVSDECKLVRKQCHACIPLLKKTLDETITRFLDGCYYCPWPLELTLLITTFLWK